MTVYRASPIKRKRRTASEIQTIKDAIVAVVRANRPCTVRQVFYRLVAQQVIEKKESEYDNTVCRLLLQLREAGAVPFSSIADNTRWQRKPRSYSSMEDALEATARTYRRALWNDQDVYVEIWCEKDALAGVLYEETAQWEVPLMVSRGFASATYLHNCAMNLQGEGKPSYLYYFGDHDPSGVAIDQNIEKRLLQWAPDVDLHFCRAAVLAHQIEELSLPTRPTKTTDSRAKNFQGGSVELDAIEPARLRLMVRECIEQHVDQAALRRTREVEKQERQLLRQVARGRNGHSSTDEQGQ